MRVFSTILFLLFCYNLASAHSCLTYSRTSDEEYRERLQKVDAIFYGEVIAVGQPMKNQDEFKYGSQSIKVKILRVWKGIETNETDILYTRAYTTFEEEIGSIGTKKMFYAWKSGDESNLHVDSCSFTAFDDERMKREYGGGKVLEQHPVEQIVLKEKTENPQGFWAHIWKTITSFFS